MRHLPDTAVAPALRALGHADWWMAVPRYLAPIGPMSDPCPNGPPAIRLFGPIAVADGERSLGPGDFGGSRPKQVLEILLAARGRSVPVDQIAEMLWGERLPDNFAGSIQTFVSALRRHLCTDATCARQLVVTERGAYRFAVERASIDLDRFLHLDRDLGGQRNVPRQVTDVQAPRQRQ